MESWIAYYCISAFLVIAFHTAAGSDSEPPLLLLASRNDIKAISISSGNQASLVDSFVNVVDVDYDYDEELMFFHDATQKKIFLVSNISTRSNLFLPTSPEVIVNNTELAQTIAYDWVHKVLYWTEARKDTIELLTIQGRHHLTIVDTNLDLPGGIAVDPRVDQGWIYWTDWGRKPKIEKAGLDGSHRTLLLATGLGKPVDLTIDYAGNSLYWTDTRLDSISSCDLNGQNVRVVFSDARFTQYPFSIDVFGHMVYWSDWRSDAIYEVDTTDSSPNARTVRRTSLNPLGLRIYHQARRPKGENPCRINNGGCSHICLASPAIRPRKQKSSCFCPDIGC